MNYSQSTRIRTFAFEDSTAIVGQRRTMRILVLATAAALFVSAPTIASAATTYTYDTLGRLSSVTYDNGKTIVYTYDAAGNRTQVVISP